MDTLFLIAIITMCLGLGFCFGALSQLKFTDKVFRDWRKTIEMLHDEIKKNNNY